MRLRIQAAETSFPCILPEFIAGDRVRSLDIQTKVQVELLRWLSCPEEVFWTNSTRRRSSVKTPNTLEKSDLATGSVPGTFCLLSDRKPWWYYHRRSWRKPACFSMLKTAPDNCSNFMKTIPNTVNGLVCRAEKESSLLSFFFFFVCTLWRPSRKDCLKGCLAIGFCVIHNFSLFSVTFCPSSSVRLHSYRNL